MEDLGPTLVRARDVLPAVQVPAADGSNKGQCEFIRLVLGLEPDALYGVCPLYKAPLWAMIMMTSTSLRENTQAWAAGRIARNTDHHSSLTPREKACLAGLGVNADDLRARMNARTDIQAWPLARTFVDRDGGVHALIRRPVLMMKHTAGGQGELRHEPAHRPAVPASAIARSHRGSSGKPWALSQRASTPEQNATSQRSRWRRDSIRPSIRRHRPIDGNAQRSSH